MGKRVICTCDRCKKEKRDVYLYNIPEGWSEVSTNLVNNMGSSTTIGERLLLCDTCLQDIGLDTRKNNAGAVGNNLRDQLVDIIVKVVKEKI